MSKWTQSELRRFLDTHSVQGYRVTTHLFGAGTIEKQIRPEKGGFIFYKVVADKPMPFKKFASEMDVSSTPMDLEGWVKKFVRGGMKRLEQGDVGFPAIAWDLRETLEKGGKVSPADSLFRELLDRGCLDVEQRVFCHTFSSDQVEILTPPKKGIGVEVEGARGSTAGAPWAGRVVSHSQKTGIVRIQLFAPVSFMKTPEALEPREVKKGDAFPETWIIGKGIAHMMEDQEGIVLPAGRYSEDGEEYLLESPIPLEEFEEVCRRYYPDEPLCLKQAMMMSVLPLYISEVTLRPLPEEKNLAEQILVDIGPIPEGEYEHIAWEEEEEEKEEEGEEREFA